MRRGHPDAMNYTHGQIEVFVEAAARDDRYARRDRMVDRMIAAGADPKQIAAVARQFEKD